MKRRHLSAICFLLFVAGFAQADEKITASDGTVYSFPSVSALVDETAAKGALRIADLAQDAFKTEAKKVVGEDAVNQEKVKTFRRDGADLKGEFQAKFVVPFRGFDAEFKGMNERITGWNIRMGKVNAGVQALNGLPAGQQNPAEQRRLQAEADQIAKERKHYQPERERIEARAAQHDKVLAAMKVRFDAMRGREDQLRAVHQSLQVKKGEAYRQLERCAAYRAELLQRFPSVSTTGAGFIDPNLNSTMESLKAGSNAPFDGSPFPSNPAPEVKKKKNFSATPNK